MSGLDYDTDDLAAPSKAVEVNRAFEAIREESGRTSVGYFSTNEKPDNMATTSGCNLLTNDGLESVLVGELDPMTTDRKRTERLFADTRQLDHCIAQAENLQDMLHSESMALKVVGILSFGLRKSGELLADAIYQQKMAKTELRRAQAIAALETFGQYMADKKIEGIDIKSTDSTRGHYINIDESVLKAAEREAFYEAIVSQLDTYKTQFTMAMSAVKAMISKQRGDSMISGVATPTALEPEGVL